MEPNGLFTGNISKGQAAIDILESIALQNAAISNILYAQGQTLQGALQANGFTPEQIIRINHSIQNTITLSTLLEIVLRGQAQSIQNIINLT